MKATWEEQHFNKLIAGIETKIARLEEQKSKAGAELDRESAEWEAKGWLGRYLTDKPRVSWSSYGTEAGRKVFWIDQNIGKAEVLLTKVNKAKASFADSVTLSDDELRFIQKP